MVDFVHEGLFKSRPRQHFVCLRERENQVALEQKLFMCPSSELKAYTSGHINLTVTVVKLAETDVEIHQSHPLRTTVAK